MRFSLSVLIVFLLLNSCEQEPGIERGFYHWNSRFSLTDSQLNFLEEINAEVLYVHYFDVIMGEQEPLPIAEVKMDTETNLSIVPVVYITTAVFSALDSTEIPDFAQKVYQKITDIHGSRALSEIQMDCDWTPSVQDKYFYFLEQFKSIMPDKTKLSATVRLYQYKYPDIAGVPPVDRGLLMYYNMGSLTDYHEPNSILNNKLGEQYLVEKEYPLPLDIALPNFSWALLFRQGEFQQICPQFSENELKNSPLFVSDQADHYIFTKDTVMYETYFRFGDELRYESCSEQELLKAAEMIEEKIAHQNARILIYHLQEKTINDYEKLDAVYRVFE